MTRIKTLQAYCKRWCKKVGVGVRVLNDLKNEFLRIVDIRIEHFTTHPHLYKRPPSRSVKTLKRNMEKLHSKYILVPADKAANNVITNVLSEKILCGCFKGGLEFYEYICTCSADERQTSFASYRY